MIKYRAMFGKIEAVEVLRETEKMVYMSGGRRVAKMSCCQTWHDTWEDAQKSLLESAQRKVAALRLQLEKAKGELGNIKGMKAP